MNDHYHTILEQKSDYALIFRQEVTTKKPIEPSPYVIAFLPKQRKSDFWTWAHGEYCTDLTSALNTFKKKTDQDNWTPAIEVPPESKEFSWVLPRFLVLDADGQQYVASYCHENKDWHVIAPTGDYFEISTVVAWQELPIVSNNHNVTENIA